MKAFWWFKDNSIAGMARPGFNGVKWLDLPFDETLIFGWLGQRSCGSESVVSLKKHFKDYGSKIRNFHKIDEIQFQKVCADYEQPVKILAAFQKVADFTNCIEHFEMKGDQISFRLNKAQLGSEIAFLKNKNINSVVTLTENHNQGEELKRHFNVHHLGIEDLNAPKFEQAEELAKIIEHAKARGQGIAVHCMAGIGRTSTMLIAAHILLGESHGSLMAQLKKKNPAVELTRPQAEFLHSVAAKASV